MTVYQLLTALREAHRTVVIAEYDNGIFPALDGEDREAIVAVGRSLRDAKRSAAVLVRAPGTEHGFRALLRTADQVVRHYADRPARTTARRRSPIQAALVDGNGRCGEDAGAAPRR